MNVLALDTASSCCAMALQSGDRLFTCGETEPAQRSEHVLTMLNNLLAQAGIDVNDLHRLAWNAGPGSFTGLRIGASVLQALAYTLRLPILSLSALELQAETVIGRVAGSLADDKAIPVAIAMDARMNGVYWALFSYERGGLERRQDDQLLSVEQLAIRASMLLTEPCVIAGDAWRQPLLQEVLKKGGDEFFIDSSDQDGMARALQILRVAGRMPNEVWNHDPISCIPHYLQGASHWKKRERRLAPIVSGGGQAL